MALSFPEFREPTTIDGGRSWTAAFDSFDQRNDDVYYLVTVQPDADRFLVRVWPYWAGDDWRGPAFIERLHDEVHAIAVSGRTNVR